MEQKITAFDNRMIEDIRILDISDEEKIKLLYNKLQDLKNIYIHKEYGTPTYLCREDVMANYWKQFKAAGKTNR